MADTITNRTRHGYDVVNHKTGETVYHVTTGDVLSDLGVALIPPAFRNYLTDVTTAQADMILNYLWNNSEALENMKQILIDAHSKLSKGK